MNGPRNHTVIGLHIRTPRPYRITDIFGLAQFYSTFAIILTKTHHEKKQFTHMSKGTALATRLLMRPAKTQISLRIRAVWSESSLSALRRFAFLATRRVPCENSDQTARMRRLIWVFAERPCKLAGNAVPQPIYEHCISDQPVHTYCTQNFLIFAVKYLYTF